MRKKGFICLESGGTKMSDVVIRVKNRGLKGYKVNAEL